MNETIENILKHRSIREFKNEPLTDEQIRTIVTSAQAASTSSYIQAYTIIGVKDPVKKKKLAELAGNQKYVEENGHFFVFCADLYRHEKIGEWEEADVTPALESTEKFMVALIDASLAAQNASIAAESMGLGICYIGGIRNDLDSVSEVLGLPERVIPLFGLAVGIPENHSDIKPRLPLESVYHEDSYNRDEAAMKEGLVRYDETISAYYHARTAGKRSDRWTGQMAKMLSGKKRMYMKEFVEKKGFNKR
ncbi:oxygen-insensitive NADPH nitroreductase [Bacillus sp. AFS015802]|uniref:oxygen-insensitive NADPH nitroreductase n=1 Tax=Bacillus sp. AFS015802 TaxID=2033486 RepID=UPI000BF90202|nr:oxygen-insensitive NADPH nitroreductase [Bacillus sp. AFS015802]PFA69523.1 oxygen-insensitive NADPH nitroreductase [Bacillus sp. AFS015802]